VSDGHLTDISVTFEAVQLLERSRSLEECLLGFAFRFLDLHVSGGLMLAQGNDLTHVCESSVIGDARRIVLHKHIRTLGERSAASGKERKTLSGGKESF
jgi:hypothetical protein